MDWLVASAPRWSRRRQAAILTLSLAVIVGTSPPATDGAGATSVRTYEVVTKRSGSASLRLPDDVRFDSNFAASIHGDGRLVGFVLTKDDPRDSTPPTIMGFQTGRCSTRGCRSDPAPLPVVFGMNLPDGRIPGGVYRMYVIADGARARIELRFRNLSGQRKIRLTDQIESDVWTLTPRLEQAARTIVYSAGDSIEPSGRGIAVVSLWIRGKNVVTSAIGGCVYQTDPPPDDVAFIPPCPQSEVEPFIIGPHPPGRDEPVYQNIEMRFPRALGAYRATVGPVEELGAVAAWVLFE